MLIKEMLKLPLKAASSCQISLGSSFNGEPLSLREIELTFELYHKIWAKNQAPNLWQLS